jgi:hypothetical protein
MFKLLKKYQEPLEYSTISIAIAGIGIWIFLKTNMEMREEIKLFKSFSSKTIELGRIYILLIFLSLSISILIIYFDKDKRLKWLQNIINIPILPILGMFKFLNCIKKYGNKGIYLILISSFGVSLIILWIIPNNWNISKVILYFLMFEVYLFINIIGSRAEFSLIAFICAAFLLLTFLGFNFDYENIPQVKFVFCNFFMCFVTLILTSIFIIVNVIKGKNTLIGGRKIYYTFIFVPIICSIVIMANIFTYTRIYEEYQLYCYKKFNSAESISELSKFVNIDKDKELKYFNEKFFGYAKEKKQKLLEDNFSEFDFKKGLVNQDEFLVFGWDPFYYATINFFTIGFGDIVPRGEFLKFSTMSQAFSGYICGILYFPFIVALILNMFYKPENELLVIIKIFMIGKNKWKGKFDNFILELEKIASNDFNEKFEYYKYNPKLLKNRLNNMKQLFIKSDLIITFNNNYIKIEKIC